MVGYFFFFFLSDLFYLIQVACSGGAVGSRNVGFTS